MSDDTKPYTPEEVAGMRYGSEPLTPERCRWLKTWDDFEKRLEDVYDEVAVAKAALRGREMEIGRLRKENPSQGDLAYFIASRSNEIARLAREMWEGGR